MRSKQQKQIDSGGEFQEIGDQIQTLNTETYATPARKKPTRKTKQSEKMKLELFSSTLLSQACSPKINKILPQAYGKIIKIGSATFRSNFQCGHIGGVELIGAAHYRISLDCESNSTRGNTWFYFTVQGVKGEAKFTIQGFTKSSSLYNSGMKVCCKDSKEGKWRRGGVKISYANAAEEEEEKNYQLHFTYFFKNNQNTSVEFAYAFPYGLTKLQNLINTLQPTAKVQPLGRTYESQQIPVLTIGNPNSKELIILTSRVHPGQTCSSFIIQGFLKELVSDTEHARLLREAFYFKVVPMINMDGVAKGNYRFSAAGVDLNRKWKQPSEQHHPEVFYLKQMILKESKQRKVRMYIDMHGHSRKKNVFFYGCSKNSDEVQQYTQSKVFPYLMSKLHTPFSYFDCSFNIQREKEGTARVSMWKQLKIHQIFTLQASMCGSQAGNNYTQADYQKIGRKLCEGISIYFSSQSQSDSPFVKKLSKFNQEILKSLRSDPMLLKVGSFEGSGSQSQPQKGEIPVLRQAQDGKQVKRLKMSSFHTNIRNMQKQNSLKQKCEKTAPQQKDLVRQKQLFEYFFQIPSQTIHDRRTIHPPTLFTNKRTNSLSRNNNYKTVAKSITYNEEEIYVGQQKNTDKNKANLLIGWQGAQYRRVRKMAEQNWRRESSMGDFELKGLKSNKIEIENARSLIPKLSFNVQQSKHRRTSADMFFKKNQKCEQRMQMPHQQFGVLCRGRQIPL